MKLAQFLFLIAFFFAPTLLVGSESDESESVEIKLQGPSTDNSELPYVLIVGDSIAHSYLPRVRELLVKNANVYFVATPRGVFDSKTFLDLCYEKREWDLIHLNFGLSAMRHENTEGHLANAPKGKLNISPLEYDKIVAGFVNYFLGSKRKRIWATTTPIPKGITGFVEGTAKQRNAQYRTLIGARQFFLNDLYDYVDIRRSDMLRPNSIEMTDSGSRLLGEVVAGRIVEVLGEGNDENLPYVLLLGDSISGGYNIAVRELLMGKANVIWGGSVFGKNPDMAELVETTVVRREKQLGSKIEVVHFNWGLHAMKFVDEMNRLKTPETGQRCVSVEAYREDLEQFVTEFKKTGRRLIWASTTPENGSPWAKEGDSAVYNAVAAEVMKRHRVKTNDLFLFVKQNNLHDKFGDCHFNAEASSKLAIPIAESILSSLKK